MSEKQVTLAETMQNIEQVFNQNPEPISGTNLIYQFNIKGEEEGTYQLHLQEGQATVVEGNDGSPECTLTMSRNSFYKFLTGNLSGTVAFMTGKLKINGDITKAMKLETILKQYNLNE
ncbi:SCP2 sterol-binding domain-containing protein [Bacillus salitolerans]|uniref:SCP2 sterol-binding domain-containing protein n=1 Tax=Bacillus salitolerans TaxID=1437434 RepID=A0ABW4LPM3_9BACI